MAVVAAAEEIVPGVAEGVVTAQGQAVEETAAVDVAATTRTQ